VRIIIGTPGKATEGHTWILEVRSCPFRSLTTPRHTQGQRSAQSRFDPLLHHLATTGHPKALATTPQPWCPWLQVARLVDDLDELGQDCNVGGAVLLGEHDRLEGRVMGVRE